jgi:hypothetical protein
LPSQGLWRPRCAGFDYCEQKFAVKVALEFGVYLRYLEADAKYKYLANQVLAHVEVGPRSSHFWQSLLSVKYFPIVQWERDAWRREDSFL